MNAKTQVYKKKDGYVRNSTLILIAFASAFFPRIIDTLGAPPPINFVHFITVPLACGIVITTTQVRNKTQISTSKEILASLFILLGVTTASAFLNKAGIINVFLEWMLLVEPFLLLLAIICIPISPERFKRFKAWMMGFIYVHIFLAWSQHFLISIGKLAVTMMTKEDNVQGVFYLTGAGHVVGASVSMAFGFYYLISAKTAPMWMRVSVFCAAFFQLLFADAKQVLMVWLAAWLLLILINLKDIKTTLQYLIAAVLVGYTLLWCIQNLEMFAAFNTWIRPELYGSDGLATILKTQAFRIIPSYYESSLNWLFGLGPGHTVGRLGGWMLASYWNLLGPLGATIHPASAAVWDAWNSIAWLDSSFFSPLFGWAGIWGDLGFVGLAAYLYVCAIVWYRLCPDDFCKFQMLTVLVFGFIFTQMEEPGYMLSVASLIGLRWQEQRLAKVARRNRFLYRNTDIERSLELS
ncbi:hypothetical protein BZZ01_06915 [Nostocales cyanobacterium HT-58-2]|nr:hypothetical protein BZZ01_06915 [Nostocales cyanobacterium HT-58-2]